MAKDSTIITSCI